MFDFKIFPIFWIFESQINSFSKYLLCFSCMFNVVVSAEDTNCYAQVVTEVLSDKATLKQWTIQISGGKSAWKRKQQLQRFWTRSNFGMSKEGQGRRWGWVQSRESSRRGNRVGEQVNCVGLSRLTLSKNPSGLEGTVFFVE